MANSGFYGVSSPVLLTSWWLHLFWRHFSHCALCPLPYLPNAYLHLRTLMGGCPLSAWDIAPHWSVTECGCSLNGTWSLGRQLSVPWWSPEVLTAEDHMPAVLPAASFLKGTLGDTSHYSLHLECLQQYHRKYSTFLTHRWISYIQVLVAWDSACLLQRTVSYYHSKPLCLILNFSP